MKTQSRYTQDQKDAAIRRVAAGESTQAVANELGCSRALVDLWKKQARDAEAENAAINAAKPRPPEEKGAPRSPPKAKPAKAAPEVKTVHKVEISPESIEALDAKVKSLVAELPKTETFAPLTCPFCGREPVYTETVSGRHGVACASPPELCQVDAQTWGHTSRADAVTAWNRRPEVTHG